MPDQNQMNQYLDEHLVVAMREATRHRLSAFSAVLEQHRRHPTFRAQTWVSTREYGFTCECTGVEQEFRISVTDIRDELPDARECMLRFLKRSLASGRKKLRKQNHKADMTARALLFRHLTREQKWDLRATKSFKVTGADGRLYTITEGSCNNVFCEYNGQWYSLCVVTKKEILPLYDIMLAQKAILESDPAFFAKTAKAQNRETQEVYKSAAFLFGTPLAACKEETMQFQGGAPVLDIADEDLDSPQRWVEERLHA